MGRYSEIYRDIHGRDPSDYPPPLNDKIEVGGEYRMKLLTEPRIVKAGYGRPTPIVEVRYQSKVYTLYLSWVDLLNRFALLEKDVEKDESSLRGKTIVLKRIKPYRFEVLLDRSR